jgi:hypothetical protein
VVSSSWRTIDEPVTVTLRRAFLFMQLSAHRVPAEEVREAMFAPGTAALEQLAAQYGLLKPGTQGAK